MPPPNWEFVALNFFSSLAVASIAAWIAVQLALRKFRAEKLWEKRASAYERLIETIHNAKRYSSEHLVAYYENKEISEEKKAELIQLSRHAESEIWKAVDVGSFLLSDTALDIVRKYRREVDDTSGIQMWQDYLEHEHDVTDQCLADDNYLGRLTTTILAGRT